jgi:hypothetical protein
LKLGSASDYEGYFAVPAENIWLRFDRESIALAIASPTGVGPVLSGKQLLRNRQFADLSSGIFARELLR